MCTSWTCGRYRRYPAHFYACTSSLGNTFVENKNPHSKVRPKTNVSVHRKTRSSLWCRNHGVVGKMIGTRKLVIRFSIFDAMRTSAVATCAWWHTYAHTLTSSNRDIFFTNRALCATSSVKMSIANGIYSVQNAVRTTKCMKIISCVCVCVRSFCRGKETLCTDVWFVHVMSAVVSRHEIWNTCCMNGWPALF